MAARLNTARRTAVHRGENLFFRFDGKPRSRVSSSAPVSEMPLLFAKLHFSVVPSYKRATWGYFSAVCYLHGRALAQKLNKYVSSIFEPVLHPVVSETVVSANSTSLGQLDFLRPAGAAQTLSSGPRQMRWRSAAPRTRRG
jgi:hypothetical protein